MPAQFIASANSPLANPIQPGSIPGASIKTMTELTKLIAEFHATLAKFEVIAARMEERELGIDPTMRDLPFPEGVIPPPLPEGKPGGFIEARLILSKPSHAVLAMSDTALKASDG